jgi:hypothetical protein
MGLNVVNRMDSVKELLVDSKLAHGGYRKRLASISGVQEDLVIDSQLHCFLKPGGIQNH